MRNRVYGIIGISSVMANWNADFTGMPKSTSDGYFFGSDKALKYTIKKYWMNQGEKVLFIKSYKLNEKGKAEAKDKLQPKELEERYTEIFSSDKLDKNASSVQILRNLFSAVDVMNFGATFAVEGQNISITGAVQIGQGFNKYEDSQAHVQPILSPFRNSKKEEAVSSSFSRKIISDEAHYFYPFSINPQNYDEYLGFIEGFQGYTKEAYEKFKAGALIGATALNTSNKSGCENEFALFVECKENSDLYLPNLDRFVTFEKGTKNIIDLSAMQLLKEERVLDVIDKIEIYLNPYTTEIKQDLKKVKVFNIFTKEEL